MTIKPSTTIALTVAVAFFMQNLDTTAVNTAVPAMASSFGTDVIHLSAGITSYMIALAVFIPVSGWVADSLGTRKVFCSAVAFFIIASTLCGLSQTLPQFVIFRIMQGMAGAMMTPVGRLAVLKSTPKSELVTAMNYITIPALIAPILGPLIGGYLTTFWSWHWIFFLNIPISILCIILAWRNIPADDELKDIRKRFDWFGFVLSGIGFTGVMYGVELLSREDVSYWIPFIVVTISAFFIYFNYRNSFHRSNPLIDYSIIKVSTYRTTIFTGTISRMVIGVAPYLVPLMFQVGFGLSSFESGALFVATMAGNLSMKSVTVWIIRHFPFRNILIVNGLVVAFFTLLTAFLLPTTPIWMIVVVMFFSGMSRSMQFTSITSLAFSDISSEKMTPANSLYSTIQQMSSGMGIAMGAVFLRYANIINQGVPGNYSVADFRMAFIFVAVLSVVHVFGYLRLSSDAGDQIRKKINK